MLFSFIVLDKQLNSSTETSYYDRRLLLHILDAAKLYSPSILHVHNEIQQHNTCHFIRPETKAHVARSLTLRNSAFCPRIFVNRINKLVTVKEMHSVSCEAERDILNLVNWNSSFIYLTDIHTYTWLLKCVMGTMSIESASDSILHIHWVVSDAAEAAEGSSKAAKTSLHSSHSIIM